MLHYETVLPGTLELLNTLISPPFSESYYLVGGTALALQIGHRTSVDLDLFTNEKFSSEELFEQIATVGDVKIINQTKTIINLYINQVKVDFVYYQYPLIEEVIILEQIRMASLKDIAAMKIAAIIGRGTKKDFIDIYFLMKQFSLKEILDLYTQKFPDGSVFMAYKSLTYFEDAELQPMPKMFQSVTWEEIKAAIVLETRQLFP